ncbi:MAG: TonB-dependent receptor [Myxococcota bacterium]|nr:TonB-dependent receptor [Myxococcota bacterium]
MTTTRHFVFAVLLLAAPATALAQDGGASLPDVGIPPAPEPPAEVIEPDDAQPLAEGLGRLRGTVVDADSGEALIEAQVTVVELELRALTDIDGNYFVDIPPGTYSLRVFAEGKPARTFSNLIVNVAEVVRLDVALGGQGEERTTVQNEIVVVGTADRATDAVQLVRRQKAATVSDSVSAETIARTPDSTAGEAVKRVVAATVQDNRYVLIRGLGGRYSAALLNGVPLPSPDPDVASVPLDLFPATLLANLTVSKTFNPDVPGNFAGGLLQIETREFPSEFTLRIRLGVSGDTATTFKDTPTYDGGKLDFLGYDDGTRSLPDSVPRNRSIESLPRAEADAVGRDFQNVWTPKNRSALPNGGVAVVVGDTVSLAGKPLGYLASVNYGMKTTRRESVARRTDVTGSVQTDERRFTTGIQSAQLGALGNLGWALSPTQRLTLVSFYTHSSDDIAETTLIEPNGESFVNRRTSLRFTERSLVFTQLLGEHLLGDGVTLSWQLNVSNTQQKQPDTRDTVFQSTDTGDFVFVGASLGQADHFYADLGDWTYGGGADLAFAYPLGKVKVGTLIMATSRDFSSRRFRYEPTGSATSADLTQSPEGLFARDNIGSILRFREVTNAADAYAADRAVFAGYALTDIVKLSPLRIIAGARYEYATQTIDTGNDFAIGRTHTTRNVGGLLPAANLVYALTDTMNLRAAYSYTLARPTFRELAPTVFFDYARGRSSSGDPNLRDTRIHNADLRWEMFPSGTEVLAAGAFYKSFNDPIEQVFATPAGDDITYVNTDGARALGVEIEARTSFKRFSPALAPYFAAANLSLIDSQVRLSGTTEGTNRKRALQGQSPYVVNVELGGRFESTGTQLSALYNVFGKRISEVGVAGSPDAFEQPFHKLDLVITQRIAEHFVGKLAGSNLLAQDVRVKRGEVFIYRYTPGTAFSLTLEWAL